MSSRAFDLALAGSQGVTVLPDLSTALPNVGDVVAAGSVVNNDVFLHFQSPSGTSEFLPLQGGTISPGPLTVDNPAVYAGSVTIDPVGQYENPPAAGSGAGWRPAIVSYVNTAGDGGNFSDATLNAGMFVTTVYGAPNFNCFNLCGLVTYQGTGGTGQHCALIGYANRNAAAAQPTTTVAVTLTSPSNNLQIADVTGFQVPYAMPIMINGHSYGQIGVSGASGPGVITLATQVSVADGTAGNTVQGVNNPQMWGANIYSADHTGLPSSKTNSSIGIELDLSASLADDAGVRSALTIVIGNDSGSGIAEFQDCISAFCAANTNIKQVFTTNANFSQAVLDTRTATQGGSAHAIWLAQGQSIAFDASNVISLFESGNMLQLNSSAGGLHVFCLGGGWSSANFGKQIFADNAPNYNIPCIGINSADGTTPIGITGGANTINFFGMPAITNSTTPPQNIAAFSSTGCGFNGHALVTKPTITGSKGANAALASLITALANYGLVTDSTT